MNTHSGYRSILCHITSQRIDKNAVAFAFIWLETHVKPCLILSYRWMKWDFHHRCFHFPSGKEESI